MNSFFEYLQYWHTLCRVKGKSSSLEHINVHCLNISCNVWTTNQISEMLHVNWFYWINFHFILFALSSPYWFNILLLRSWKPFSRLREIRPERMIFVRFHEVHLSFSYLALAWCWLVSIKLEWEYTKMRKLRLDTTHNKNRRVNGTRKKKRQSKQCVCLMRCFHSVHFTSFHQSHHHNATHVAHNESVWLKVILSNSTHKWMK